MGTYNWDELVGRWDRKELSVNQAIGQLLQWAHQFAKSKTDWLARLASVERRLDALEARLKKQD